MSLKSFLLKIQGELKEKDNVREEIQKVMRRAIRISKQAILLTHGEKYIEARELLSEAQGIFADLPKTGKNHPDIISMGAVNAAFEEYTEAQTFLHIVEHNSFLDPTKLDVPAISYVLGLADVIGELRRRALDSLRKGNVKASVDCLQKMEQLYVELMSLDDAYMLAHGLRRKCDVARHVIEATRGDVTNEVRRDSLEKSIRRLEKIVKTRVKD
jgi:translin